ncbi:hypothetical protein ElyMa_002199800 [Elysia marginata]|uniref:Uncharacterized protein n=1 Tax=Elysia marginata TaxID=1093978 RepID=A0AAV4FRT3_9GAST|nr:hypothetical protein ElyMa_002199800 [Elysia marginata]
MVISNSKSEDMIMMTQVATTKMVVVTTMMMVVALIITMVAMIQVHREVQLANQGCRNMRPSKSKALGLRKCTALHGRRTTKVSGYSRCRLTA